MPTASLSAQIGMKESRQTVAFLVKLGQHRINRQGGIAEDFVPDQSYKAGGILYVFPSFVTAELVQKTRCDPQTHLCGVVLIIL